MENSNAITEKQSLEIIRNMIAKAKTRSSGDGTYFLVWGYLVLAASLIHFGAIKLGYEAYGGLAWILMAVGGGITGYLGYKEEKENQALSYADHFMKHLWIGFSVSIFLILFVCLSFEPKLTYPMILVLFGIGTYVSGGALEFRPLRFAGLICWILALVSVYLSFENQLLILALDVVLAFIIPGHWLLNQVKSEKI
jgi:hypothetical protein